MRSSLTVFYEQTFRWGQQDRERERVLEQERALERQRAAEREGPSHER